MKKLALLLFFVSNVQAAPVALPPDEMDQISCIYHAPGWCKVHIRGDTYKYITTQELTEFHGYKDIHRTQMLPGYGWTHYILSVTK